MTSEEIKNTIENWNHESFWLREIALQLTIGNELQAERNKELKRSVDLQESATNMQWEQGQTYNELVDHLVNNREE